jgi:hypothetical protein
MRTSHRGGETQTSIASSREDRGKTVAKPLVLSGLGLPSSEKQIPQVVENLDSGGKPREALETAAVLVRQAL